MLALIAGTVSYLHMHLLVELHGQPGWVAALTPLSVDGMIVAASTTLLAESRSGGRGGVLPWVLLAVGSAGSLAANVAVAEPTATGRMIAAWPSFALIASYVIWSPVDVRACELGCCVADGVLDAARTLRGGGWREPDCYRRVSPLLCRSWPRASASWRRSCRFSCSS
jgi:Protein of unknown function (DUF2637)